MIHRKLIRSASKWLHRSGCPVVLTGIIAPGEIPDAVGFRSSGISYLIECKVSRGDFLADNKKHFRRYQINGLGRYRYYLCPVGLIKEKELPDKWGLLYINKKGRIEESRQTDFQEMTDLSQRREIGLLVSAMRRLPVDKEVGIFVRVFAHSGKVKATVGVL